MKRDAIKERPIIPIMTRKVSEKAARECLSLPIYPEMPDDHVERVAEVIHGFFKT